METLIEQLAARGISLRAYKPGVDLRTDCPVCHGGRHREKDCLSIRIDEDFKGAAWHCKRAKCGHTDYILSNPEPKSQKVYRRPQYVPDRRIPSRVYRWFQTRGISPQIVDRYRIGYRERWFPQVRRERTCIAFPFFRNGEIVNVKYRDRDKNFLQEKDAEKILYGLDDIAETDWCVICEGEMDKLAYAEAGIFNVLSVPDGAPKTVQDKPPAEKDDRKFEYVWNCRDELARMKRIILATDNDGPGMALEEELARRLGKERCFRAAKIINLKDANEILLQKGKLALKQTVELATPYPIPGLHDANDYLGLVVQTYNGKRITNVTLGMGQEIDDLIKIFEGLLVVVTGIPNSGKSNFVDQILLNLAEHHQWSSALCSFETPPELHLLRLAAKRARQSWRGPDRMDEAKLRETVSWLRQRFFFIRDDDATTTIDWILEQAKAAVMRHGIKALVIDPYNEIEHARPKHQSETEYISDMLSKVKRFCKNHGVVCFFIAHPQKLYRDNGRIPEPTLYDISGGAHWYNKADIGFTVVRLDSSLQNDIVVHKVRWEWLGNKGRAPVFYHPSTTRYEPELPEFRNVPKQRFKFDDLPF